MCTCLRTLALWSTVTAVLGLTLTDRMRAQTFTTLYSFTATSGDYPYYTTNGDGAGPNGLVLPGSTLYGTTYSGGSLGGDGTIFALNTDATAFTNLHSFAKYDVNSGNNTDGRWPNAGLTLSGSNLFGTASAGGTSGNGTVFAIVTDGADFRTLHSFSTANQIGGTVVNNDGFNPQSELVVSPTTIFGTASEGGRSGSGTVFSMNTDGTGFATLHSFAAAPNFTNADGSSPDGLILIGDTLYGTTRFGGDSGNGTLFSVNTNGIGFKVLHSFTSTSGYPSYTNSDGANPTARLVLSGNTLYGTTPNGGSCGAGIIFRIITNGSDFSIVYNFTADSGAYPYFTNSDGAAPNGLLLSGSTLYGTSQRGGLSGNGTIFGIHTDGTGFTNLHDFTASSTNSSGIYTNTDGANPYAGLILSSNTLYGTAGSGGSSGNGTVFSISLPVSPPQLTIASAGANVILTWPTNATGFTLQSTTNLVPTGLWSVVSAWPAVVNGLNTVTNPISGTQQFFRLSY
jgi:uncharacterized repeat protein (TIGR03803 family)